MLHTLCSGSPLSGNTITISYINTSILVSINYQSKHRIQWPDQYNFASSGPVMDAVQNKKLTLLSCTRNGLLALNHSEVLGLVKMYMLNGFSMTKLSAIPSCQNQKSFSLTAFCPN